MTLLIVGLLLWTFAHYFKRLMHGQRRKGRRRGCDCRQPCSDGHGFMGQINNMLMRVVFFVYRLSTTTVSLRGKMRPPQLTAVKIWAVAHLFANIDLASTILLGGSWHGPWVRSS